ncbi:hypothetical protein HMPREF1199_00150 [Hoylesella oralis CC98A]|nr:hypothetical protein HMPREF1199_00150 [Hoylesella oralis CC98A]
MLYLLNIFTAALAESLSNKSNVENMGYVRHISFLSCAKLRFFFYICTVFQFK